VAWLDERAAKDRYPHGTVSSGTEAFSAAYTHHTITTAGDHTWSFSGFTQKSPEFSILLTVSSGTPTITLPAGSTIADDSPQTLTTLAAGKYLVEVVSFDNGTSYTVIVGFIV